MKKRRVLLVLAAILFGLSADTSNAAQKRSRSTASSRQSRITGPGSVDRFKNAFQNDTGKVRLVALLSPT
ncbi:MAG: hypothetical protein AABN33_09400 [Acidobacteriota bacterium]